MALKALPGPDRMSFLEHLEELRGRLVRSLLALVVGFAVCWGFADRIFHFITEPMRRADSKVQFIYTAPTEAFFLYMKMAFFVGIFVAAPYVLYQVWAFIAPGLYPHERAYAVPFILFGSVFFVLGGLFGHYVLFPMTFKFLGEYAGTEMTFMPKVDEYYSFYSWFLLGLGLVFQLPVVIFVLARIGLVTAGFLLRSFKYAFLASFVVSAVITPSGDIVTQSVLAVPMMGLYLLGVVVAWLFGKPRRAPEPAVSAEG
ncbi:MAG: twin-arginine translocase subunit TatC [Acidobacteria bacterium]|nr:twin-arginine translocase subunit TatC [Acidobacteriota bacterium]